MACPICGEPMQTEYEDSFNGIMSELIEVCSGSCRYEEQFAYGAHRVFINDVEYLCGDPTTIEGSLMAWRIWYAIQAAKGDGGDASSYRRG